MRPESLFAPVVVLALWTGFVLFLTGFRRIRAVVRGRLKASAFRLGESPEVPVEIAVCNRNLVNLLEMPVLFYVVAISLYVTRSVQAVDVWLAWIFVALRIAHSFIHVTSNAVVQRLVPFFASNLVLLALWIRFAMALT